MKEIWKNIVGYKGNYEISSKGRIRSLDRVVDRSGFPLHIKGQMLRPCVNSRGYLVVMLRKNNSGIQKKIHVLVTEAFHGKRPGNKVVNHKDGNQLNNSYGNLEWCTQRENLNHAIRIGLTTGTVGSKNHNSKLDESQVAEIKTHLKNNNCSKKEIAKKYDISVNMIHRISRGASWKHVK